MKEIERTLATLADTKRVAEILAAQVSCGDVLALSGEVGTGKTTFAQFFIASLLATPESITSPTFTLIQCYETTRGFALLHADLYRLNHVGELAELGLEEAFENHASLIEWPEIAAAILPKNTLYITLTHEAGDSRRMSLYSADEKWNGVL